MIKFERHPKNPILAPDKYHTWEDRAVFNPGVALYKGKFYLLYRAIGEYLQYISSVGLATSVDGVNFERKPEPVLKPLEDYEKYGIEDLRVNPLEGSFYLTYTVLSRLAPEGGRPHQVGLIKTNNFQKFERLGVITPKEFCSRNGVFFPEKFGGYYLMLHRPWFLVEGNRLFPEMRLPSSPSIWISYSENLVEWRNHQILIEPIYEWEKFKIGGGPPPIKTPKGWLFIYHGVDKKMVYRAGMMLLDLNDPRKVIYRSAKPILEPEMEYEKVGDTHNVVFPTGLVEKDGLLYLYYGAADKTICLATASLEKLLDSLK